MHSSRMRTARSLTVSRSIGGGGVSVQPPGCRPPWMQTPHADPLGRPSLGRPPLDAEPPGHVNSDACWEATPPWTDKNL